MSTPNEKAPPPQEPSEANTPDAPPPEKKKREYKEFGHEEEKATRTSFLPFYVPTQKQTG